MRTLTAAIDDSPAARAVLETAKRVAVLVSARVEAVHVEENDSGRSAQAFSDAARVPLHVRSGDVVAALTSEVSERDSIALIVGTRDASAGASPAGHIALDLLESLERPIVVVPPLAVDRPLNRILVAVEGDGASRELQGLLEHLDDDATPEVIAFHVIEPHDLPMFADSPVLEAEAFEREFMIRASSAVLADPSSVRLEMRVGSAPDALREAARDLDVDLVVMAWHRDLSEGHGRLVHEMLTGSTVPVVLFPLVPHEERNARGVT